MKILTLSAMTAAALMLTSSSAMMAQTSSLTPPGSGNGDNPVPVITPIPLPSLPPGKGIGTRPRTPAKVILYCGYDRSENRLYFSMPESMEYLSVTVQDTTSPLSWDSVVYPETPYMEAELGGSTYTIECVSGDGTVYGTTVDF